MARQNDDDEDFDGIDIDLPFFSFRYDGPWGRRGGWTGGANMDPEYRRARRRVRTRLRFYRHLATFAAVAGALSIIDWLTGGGLGWSLWIVGIWGAFLFVQGVNTFVMSNLWSRELEQRMIEREMQRHGRV